MLVIGVDPGSTTGLAAIKAPAELLLATESTDRPGLTAWIRYHKPDVVVVEDFRPHAGLPQWAPLPAPKVIGVLESDESLTVVKQSPSIKSHIPDALLKAAGMFQRGKGHANDAIRHALYYLWLTQQFVIDPKVQRIYARYVEEVEEQRGYYRKGS